MFHVEHILYKMETLSNCPVCKTPLPGKSIIVARDYLVSGKTFHIVQCFDCGFRLTNPRPGLDEISLYYNSKAYISHTEKTKSTFDFLYHLVKGIMLKRKLRLLKKHTKENQKCLLDYGCGTGSFLMAAADSGFKPSGFEPNPNAQRVLTRKGLSVVENDKILYKYNTAKYDIITLWHVLEHIHDFPGILYKFHTLLKSDGLLVIAVPISNSHDAVHYQQNWAAYDLPRHLYHFTQDTLTRACRAAGFEIIDKKPLPFDSYYVSLLSEKHLGSKFWFLKAIFQGSVSNIKAFLKLSPWSSQIFVFRKR
jgi:2-polyprenyl-3-methyl-5-hydroxy-6-metoxy-1,4-benzoquinol methylase